MRSNTQRVFRKRYGFLVAVFALLLILFLNKIVKPTFVPIPITFTPAGTPVFTVTIEEKEYAVVLDLGSKFLLSLDPLVVSALTKKQQQGSAEWRDAKGNFYASASYLIPQIKLGTLGLKNLIAKEEDARCNENGVLWGSAQTRASSTLGKIGRPLLEKTNLLLDFPHAMIFICNTLKTLQEKGYKPEEMTKVPFEAGPKGMILIAETDAGPLRLVLDTGSSLTLIRTSRLKGQKVDAESQKVPFCTTSTFLLGNRDFGSKELFLFDITDELQEIDGVLGMDFLEKYPIYIDYKNHHLYILQNHSH